MLYLRFERDWLIFSRFSNYFVYMSAWSHIRSNLNNYYFSMEQRLTGKQPSNTNPYPLIYGQPQTNSTSPFWFNSPNIHIAGLLPLLNGTLPMQFLPQVPNMLDQMAIAYQLQQLNNSAQIRNLGLMKPEGIEPAQRQLQPEQPKLATDLQPKPLKI